MHQLDSDFQSAVKHPLTTSTKLSRRAVQTAITWVQLFLITLHPRTLQLFLFIPHKEEHLDDMDLDMKHTPICNLAKASDAAPPSTPQFSPAAKAHCESANSVVRKVSISSLLPASSPLHSSEQKVVGVKCLNSNFSGVATITSTKPLWAPQENDAPLNLSKDFHSQKVVFHLFKVFNWNIALYICRWWIDKIAKN